MIPPKEIDYFTLSHIFVKMSNMKTNLIYLDNAASTELSKSVFLAMKPYLEAEFGNPSSLHEFGRKSRQAVDQARGSVAKVLGANPKEIIFTAGGTESTNLAIFGVAKAHQTKYHKAGHMIVSKIEHETVLECVKALQQWGWKIDYLTVNSDGVVSVEDLKKKIKPDTALVSVMYANNEVGTIQPVTEVGRALTGINKVRSQKNLPPIYFHSDACQAGGVLELDVHKLKVDLLTLNGSKINGPKGSGILFARTGIKLEPIIYGGGQERGLRSGTENTPAIVGFAKALELSQKSRTKNLKTLLALQKYLEAELKQIKLMTINGPSNFSVKKNGATAGLLKLPGTINFSIKGIEGEALMFYLNAAGFAVATGSACTASSDDPSHVLLAMGLTPEQAKSAIRLSLSTEITKADLKRFVTALKNSIKILQRTTQNL